MTKRAIDPGAELGQGPRLGGAADLADRLQGGLATWCNDYEDARLRSPSLDVTEGLPGNGLGRCRLRRSRSCLLSLTRWVSATSSVSAVHRFADADGLTRHAVDWMGKGGRVRKFRHARVTAQGRQVGAVACLQARSIKEPWCPAASDPEATVAMLVSHCAPRSTIEPSFRNT